jgi:preprotein translocase subunit SecF
MMSRVGSIPGRLYRGEVSINFVGRQRLWYTISGLILLISIVSLSTRWLNFSIEFKGGTQIQFSAPKSVTLNQVHNVLVNTSAGSQAVAQSVGSGGSWQVQAAKLPFKEIESVQTALTSAIHAHSFSDSFIGPTWGSQISGKAGEALIIFLIVIVIYLSIAFEWRMAAAAFVALIHDIVITIGVYSLAGFTVSPASVIGLLTILGYSLYDTVVVFDKVRENTAGLLGSGKSTYSQAANLALNQTLVRSINTSLIALLPVASILFIGTAVLGPGELQDLALVLFVGMLSGTYSSICIATPVLADLKEREHQYKVLAKRVALREAGGRSGKRAAAKSAKAAAGAGTGQASPPQVQNPPKGPTITINRGRSAPGAPVDTGAAGADIGTGYTGEPDDVGEPDDQAAGLTGTGPLPAGQGTSASGGVRPTGPRQQPRRTSAAQRRPGSNKKKKR